MATTGGKTAERPHAFRHEALLYSGLGEFGERTASWIADGLADGDPVLVVVSREKIERLRALLGADADKVDFRDMADVGANPARIIPAWYDFVEQRAADGRFIRGIGEPINPERSPDALVECQRHESLLNLAFSESSAWWLLCPYDLTALPADVIDEARASHPWVTNGNGEQASNTYRELEEISKPFDHPLPEPPVGVHPTELQFGKHQLDSVRSTVADEALTNRMPTGRAADLVLAANEVATNSVRYGGGRGRLRVWREDERLVVEVRDQGRLDNPLAGRKRPNAGQEGGFGVWLVHQLCDLVQIRTFTDGSVIRLHMAIA